MSLFDERNLFELAHSDFPDERLVACRNPELAARRAAKRDSLLAATAKELETVRRMVRRGRLRGQACITAQVDKILGQYKIGKYYTLEARDDGFDCTVNRDALAADVVAGSHGRSELADKRRARSERHIAAIAKKLEKLRRKTERGQLYGQDQIGVRVGKVINKYKVGKHLECHIKDDAFDFEIDQQKVTAEAALDGIYIVRTSVVVDRMGPEQTVRSYKLLSNVEQAFRCLKSLELLIRPIRHRLEQRVRAHIFICMLAYYVQWHMMEAWRPLLFADEDQEAKTSRDPVAPARRSDAAKHKVHTKRLDDGSIVHSFRTLLGHLGEIVRNTCRTPGLGPDAPTFYVTTSPNPKQQQALDLLRSINL